MPRARTSSSFSPAAMSTRSCSRNWWPEQNSKRSRAEHSASPFFVGDDRVVRSTHERPAAKTLTLSRRLGEAGVENRLFGQSRRKRPHARLLDKFKLGRP